MVLMHLKNEKNPTFLISILLIFISFVWAGSFIAVDATVDEIPPISLGFIRFLVAIPFMILFLFLLKKDKRIPLKELPYLSVLGLTGVTFLYIFQYLGIDFTNSSTSAVLISTNVIFIVILSVIFLKEKMSFTKSLGVIFSFLGVIFVVFAQMMNEKIIFDELFLLGCIFIISSAFCWAIYSIVGKRLLKKYDAFTVITYSFILGIVFYLPFIFNEITNSVINISSDSWIAILYLSFVCAVFGYLGWYYAIERIEASKAAVFLTFIPLFAIILSSFYGESLTLFFIVGAFLIMFGVYLTQRS